MTRISYTQGPGRWGQLISQHNSDTGQSRYYGFDPMGHTRFLADSNGTITDTYSYKAFGELVTSSGSTSNPLCYGGAVGYYRDKIERVYVRARHYEPPTGRWLSRDPIGFEGGDWNLYRYVRNNPLHWVDPKGVQQSSIGYNAINELAIEYQNRLEAEWQGIVMAIQRWYGPDYIAYNPSYGSALGITGQIVVDSHFNVYVTPPGFYGGAATPGFGQSLVCGWIGGPWNPAPPPDKIHAFLLGHS